MTTGDVATPIKQSRTPNAVIASAGAVSSSEAELDEIEYQRACLLARRLKIALFDLGFDGVLKDWISPTSEGLAFKTLTIKQADQFTRVLEDVSRDHTAAKRRSFTPHPNQLQLF